jgi:glycosyltransferase involved in cell wall biosynthesis
VIDSSSSCLVTIWCPTYNHKSFIKQAIEGFLSQKISFNYEIVIHDDASFDGTTEILKEYELRYPQTIRCIYQVENQLSKDKGHLVKSLRSQAKGKYIALCEGDDYWTDPYKLQKQVDFLESNPSFSMCFHRAMERNEMLSTETIIPEGPINTSLRLADLLKGNNFIPTNSCVFWSFSSPLPTWLYQVPFADYGLHLINAKRGNIGFIDEVMGVYRINASGMHGKLKSSNYGLVTAYQQHIHFWEIIKQTGEFDEVLVQEALNKSIGKFEYYQKNSQREQKLFAFAKSIWRRFKAGFSHSSLIK